MSSPQSESMPPEFIARYDQVRAGIAAKIAEIVATFQAESAQHGEDPAMFKLIHWFGGGDWEPGELALTLAVAVQQLARRNP